MLYVRYPHICTSFRVQLKVVEMKKNSLSPKVSVDIFFSICLG
jgi:hypothetical protein